MKLEEIIEDLGAGKEVETKGCYLTPVLKSTVMGIPCYSVSVRSKAAGGCLKIDNAEMLSMIMSDEIMRQEYGICCICGEFIDNRADDVAVFRDPAGNWYDSITCLEKFMNGTYGDDWKLTEDDIVVKVPEEKVLSEGSGKYMKDEDGFWMPCGIRNLAQEGCDEEEMSFDETAIQI